MATGYWKRFVVLVTDSVHKYRSDPFVRTEVNLILLQITFTSFLLAVIALANGQLYHDASVAVAHGIISAGQHNADAATISSAVLSELDERRSRMLAYASTFILLVSVGFTYFIARVALTPTHNALESQKQFIGNVAHELRTPLSIIRTNAEVVLMKPVLDEELQRYLKSAIEEIDRISEIINNLLSLSASMRPERIEFGDIDLGLVLTSVMDKLRGLAQSKNLSFEARVSERRAVWGNAMALEQIALNVIKNAILYTPRGGRVLVTIEPVYPNFIEFTVHDSGIGIARSDLFRIFEPYYRSDPSRHRTAGGSGLGLTIVSELVKLHRGKITVRSGEGRGTTVSIMFVAGKVDATGREITKKERAAMDEIAVDFSLHNSPHKS